MQIHTAKRGYDYLFFDLPFANSIICRNEASLILSVVDVWLIVHNFMVSFYLFISETN